MSILLGRKFRYYLRLQYPVRAFMTEAGFVGRLPDLPGCECNASTPRELYERLETKRREWIAERLARGEHVPMPNSHLTVGKPQPSNTRRSSGDFAPAA